MLRRLKRWASLSSLVVLVWGLAVPGAVAQEQGRRLEPTDGARRWPIDPETAPRPMARAAQASGRIVIDAKLDEPAWAGAEPISEFIQAQPRLGYPATERTVVRILYDRDNIYVGAVAYDSDPGRLIVTSLERDFPALSNDVISIVFDPKLDRRNGFLFTVNPAGAIGDAQAFDDHRSLDYAWNGVVSVATAITDSGWTMELAIPFTTLRFDGRPGEQAWGLNVNRRVRRTNEVSYWAPLGRRELIPKVSRAGTLFGLEDLKQGRNLQVKPYVLGARLEGAARAEADVGYDLDAGVDLKYGLTSALTFDATYRTDFSHVEADQEQVNLTRFPLFFPERREFFIENSGTFLFGDLTERGYLTSVSQRDFTLFHTRRIGLTPQGRPIPMLGGVRLSGKTGPYQVGVVSMQTQGTANRPSENFSVVRLRRALLGNSDVGLMVTSRQYTAPGDSGRYNRAYGVDANVRPLGYLIINSYFATVDATSVTDDATAGRVSVGWRDRFWNVGAMYRRFGDGFDPGLGFVRRRGMQHYYGTIGVHYSPGRITVQEINPYVQVDYITNLAALLETRSASAGISLSFADGGELSLGYSDEFERLSRPFGVAPNVTIAEGDYDYHDASISYASNAARSFSGRGSFARGGYYDGTKWTAGLGATWRPNRFFVMDLSLSRNDVELPAGAFTADLAGLRLSLAGSTRLFGSAHIQYNGQSDETLINLRGRFIHSPLSDLYLVYTDRRKVGTGDLLERSLTLKATKLLAF